MNNIDLSKNSIAKNWHIHSEKYKKTLSRILRYIGRVNNLRKYIEDKDYSYKYIWYFFFYHEKYKLFCESEVSKINYSVELEHLEKESKCDSYRVWTMWWQGNNMPVVVEKCIESMKQNSRYEVVVITSENVNQYIEIPQYIKKRVDEGRMTYTHLSDYIRICLLYKYGGLWLDSCIYVTKKMFDYEKYKIYTIKNNTTLYCSFCIGSNTKFHKFFGKTKLLMESYYKNNKYLVDYFLMDYIMKRVIAEDRNINQTLKNLEKNNEDFHYLLRNLSNPFLYNEWNNLMKNHVFQKVSYKKAFLSKKNGMVTYGGYFFDED